MGRSFFIIVLFPIFAAEERKVFRSKCAWYHYKNKKYV